MMKYYLVLLALIFNLSARATYNSQVFIDTGGSFIDGNVGVSPGLTVHGSSLYFFPGGGGGSSMAITAINAVGFDLAGWSLSNVNDFGAITVNAASGSYRFGGGSYMNDMQITALDGGGFSFNNWPILGAPAINEYSSLPWKIESSGNSTFGVVTATGGIDFNGGYTITRDDSTFSLLSTGSININNQGGITNAGQIHGTTMDLSDGLKTLHTDFSGGVRTFRTDNGAALVYADDGTVWMGNIDAGPNLIVGVDKVGIGIASSTTKLDVRADSVDSIGWGTTSKQYGILTFSTGHTSDAYAANIKGSTDGDTSLVFEPSPGNYALTMLANGNVGIGTATSPTHTLEMGSSYFNADGSGSLSSGAITFNTTGDLLATSLTSSGAVTGTSFTNADGHLILTGPAASIDAGCGSGGTLEGNDNVARITLGTGIITSCQILFGHNWTNAPHCSVNDEDGVPSALKWLPTTSGLNITATSFTAGDHLSYSCVGY